jgi:hypothetical protein
MRIIFNMDKSPYTLLCGDLLQPLFRLAIILTFTTKHYKIKENVA